MEMEELVKILIVVVVLVLVIGVIYVLLRGKGFGEEGILAGIKNLFRFGRA